MRLLVLAAAAALVAGCALVYKIDVQQGNYVTEDQVAKLRPGMSKGEVKQILGTPLLNDIFHANRWDYYFSNAKRGKEMPGERRELVLLFENDKLVSFKGTAEPAPPPRVQAPAAAPSASAAPPGK